MTTDPPVNTPQFLASFKGFMDQVVRQAPAPEEPREALHELVVEGGELTRHLLGVATAPPAARRDGC